MDERDGIEIMVTPYLKRKVADILETALKEKLDLNVNINIKNLKLNTDANGNIKVSVNADGFVHDGYVGIFGMIKQSLTKRAKKIFRK